MSEFGSANELKELFGEDLKGFSSVFKFMMQKAIDQSEEKLQ
jgi:hypothetical protein